MNRVRKIPADWRLAGRWFLLAGVVGMVSGVGAIVFFGASEWLFELAIGDWVGYSPRPPGGEAQAGESAFESAEMLRGFVPWLLVVVPAVGGLLSGIIVFRFAPEAEGHGTDAALRAYHENRGIIHWRVPLVKTVASILTLGTGGSGGREGPIAQIGAGFGSLLASRLGLSARERRILLAAGMGAGVAAIFRAPLAGALFAAEIHYREAEFESEVIIPSALASIIGYCTFGLAYGYRPLFTTPPGFGFGNFAELVPYTVLAVAVAFGAWLFVRVFYGTRDLFSASPIPRSIRPMIGGAATGALALALWTVFDSPEVLSVMGFGYGALQGALDGVIPAAEILLIVALGKMVATGLTIGSGGSSGVFGPSMVIGGAIGGAVGLALSGWFPTLVPHPGAYVIVGMAGFFAGAANTPISTIIMVSEMTRNYDLLLPALWVTTIAFVLLRNTSLYENQLPSIRNSPAHRGDFFHDVLAGITVGDVVRDGQEVVTFPATASLGEILHRVDRTHQNYFPVLNEDGEMIRIFSLNDVRPYFYAEMEWEQLKASDLGTDEVVTVSGRDSLSRAIRRLTERNIDAIPVVAVDAPRRVVGLLRRKELVDAYHRRLESLAEES